MAQGNDGVDVTYKCWFAVRNGGFALLLHDERKLSSDDYSPVTQLVRFLSLHGRHAQVILQAAVRRDDGACRFITPPYLVTSCTMDELSGSP